MNSTSSQNGRVIEVLTAKDRAGRTWELERVVCPVCGLGESSVAYEWNCPYDSIPMNFSIAACSGCGFLFTNPRLSHRALAEYYSTHGPYMDEAYHDIDDVRPRYQRLLAAFTRHGVAGGRLLEIGCDKGQFLRIARERGFAVEGIEPSAGADIAREKFGLDVRRVGIEAANLRAEGFQAVVILDVLEHITWPMDALAEINRVLAPGGLLLVKVPNVRHEHGLYPRLRTGALGFGAHEHLNHFSQHTLTDALGRAGMEPVEWLGFVPLLGHKGARGLAVRLLMTTGQAIAAAWPGWPDHHVALVCLARKVRPAPGAGPR